MSRQPQVTYAMPGEPPVAVRFPPDEIEQLRDAAASLGLTVSAYLRAVDGGAAATEAEALGITRGALVRLLALGRGADGAKLLRAAAKRVAAIGG